MKRILIIGEQFSDNLGDGVICGVVADFFSAKNEVQVFDLSLRKKYISEKSTPPFSILRKSLSYCKRNLEKICGEYKRIHSLFFNTHLDNKRFLNEFTDYISMYQPEAIIFAGGQIFMQTFIDRTLLVLSIAQQSSIPVCFNAVGYGYLLKYQKKELDSILTNPMSCYISVRDGKSYLSQLGPSVSIVDTVDSALLCSDVFNIQRKQSDVLGLGIMFSKNHPVKEQIDFWKCILNKMLEYNVPFKLFCNGSAVDISFMEYISRYCSLPTDYISKNPNSPVELVELISSFKAILSMRLHSHIIAYSLQIPSVAVAWDRKVEEFFEKIELSQRCFSLQSNIDEILDVFLSAADTELNLVTYGRIISEASNNLKRVESKVYEITK